MTPRERRDVKWIVAAVRSRFGSVLRMLVKRILACLLVLLVLSWRAG